VYPLARKTELIVEALPSETIVYDTTHHRVHCLNKTASLIWRHCDGQTSVHQIAHQLSQTLRAPADVDVVRLGLRELHNCGLLVRESADTTAVSRRDLSKHLSILGGSFALLPAITSIVAPTPAMADSQDDNGDGDGNGRGKKKQG